MLAKDARILVVDDSSNTRKIMTNFLKQLGYTNILESGDGLEAWNRFVGSHPRIELVISDWHMPNLSGLELLSKIRSNHDTSLRKTPVILATAERKIEEIKKAIEAGASGYIVKPYELDTVEKAINKVKKDCQPSSVNHTDANKEMQVRNEEKEKQCQLEVHKKA